MRVEVKLAIATQLRSKMDTKTQLSFSNGDADFGKLKRNYDGEKFTTEMVPLAEGPPK